jgi:hypothetical protein
MKDYYILRIGEGLTVVLTPDAIFYIIVFLAFILVGVAGYLVRSGMI